MSIPNGGELIVLLLVLLLLFGASRLPKLARSMGASAQEFKKGLKEGYKEESPEGPCPFCGTQIAADAKFCPGCGKSAEEVVAAKAKEQKTA